MSFKKNTYRPKSQNNETPKFTGRSIFIREGEDPDRAFKKLTRKLKEDGFFEVLREREFFSKPSVSKKTALARAKSREERRLAKSKSEGIPVYNTGRGKKNRGKKTKRRNS